MSKSTTPGADSATDERALFEAHFGPKDAFAWVNESGRYKIGSLQSAWEIWQTARAAITPRVAADATAWPNFEAWLASPISPPANQFEYARAAFNAGRAVIAADVPTPNWRALYEETLAQLLICKAGPHAHKLPVAPEPSQHGAHISIAQFLVTYETAVGQAMKGPVENMGQYATLIADLAAIARMRAALKGSQEAKP